MVDGWDLARRKYDQIAPDTSAPMTRAQSEQLIQWLKSDVYHLTSSVLNHPGFRRRALWPLEKLSRGSASEERILVMNVERSLVQFAQSLLKFAERNEIRELLHRLGEHLEELETPTTPIGLSQVRFLSTSPWKDLVSIADYFGPVAQFNYREDDTEQWAISGSFCPDQRSSATATGTRHTSATRLCGSIENTAVWLHAFGSRIARIKVSGT